MFYKCEMMVGGYAYAVTDSIKNWDEITASFKRSDYDGIVRTFTDKFEFVKGARQLLINEYKTNYLKSNATIVISTRNNSWNWTERFRCALNFSTMADDGLTLSINAVDDSVAALIKAKKGTQYEYVVEEVADKNSLRYDHLMMLNTAKFIDGGTLSESNEKVSYIEFVSGYSSSTLAIYSFPMYIEGSPEIYNKNKCEIGDVDLEQYTEWKDVPPFFLTRDKTTVSMSFSFKVHGIMDKDATFSSVFLRFGKMTRNKQYVSLGHWDVYNENYKVTEVSFNEDIPLEAGESLVFGIVLVSVKEGDKLYLIEPTGFKMSFYSRGNINFLRVVNPTVLLNRLLKSMNGGKEGLNGVIVPSGEKRLDNAVLLPGESIRMMPNAKIYTSFSKFSQWMSAVFGYVYDIDNKTITFRHRSEYFKDTVVKEIENFNGYQMSVNSSLIFSQVNIGYDKQDYDSVNGKDEFRFTNIYNTGVTMTDNKLEIISPYRADAYGIEFLTQKIGENTTDNESDTSMFFVCIDPSTYTLDRSDEIEGVISPETMFNAMYAPTSMIKANEAFLGGYISQLDYASSEGNTAVRIKGNTENRDISLSKGLFSVNEVSLETSDIDLPSDMTGAVQFEHNGEIYRGFYKSADFSYTKTKSAKITLIMKK